MASATKFQNYCQKIINVLTDDVKENFEKYNDDLSRIKYIYDVVKQIKLEIIEPITKSIERAETLKVSANKLYKCKNFLYAIHVYNEALINCPQDSIEGKQLHDILIANRSAAFFEMREYRKVIKDVEFLEVYDHHPTPHKIYIRAGKAWESLNNYTDALNYYKKALKQLQNKKDLNKDEQKQLIEMQRKLNDFKEKPLKTNKTNKKVNGSLKLESVNMTYPALLSKLKVKSSAECGRYVVAKEDIKTGETIAVEEPYVSVLYKNTFRTNCASCLRSTNQPIVCECCLQGYFCSIECKEAANIYHKNECKILATLFEYDVSLNCLMALRMITHQSLDEIKQQANELDKERNIVIYKTNDYYNVNKLVAHSDRRSQIEFLHYTLMSIYLLRLLKTTNYFGAANEDEILTDDEAFVGSLILKHLQILQFNSHEIGELQHNYEKSSTIELFTTATVGAGLYPTLALFNHSCDPSLVRYNVGKAMVLKAIKHIKRNEIIYENYGYLYASDVREKRIEKLRELYWFDCNCKACTEYWPLYRELENQNVMRIACDCSEVLIVESDIQVPLLICGKCKNTKNILPILAQLMPLKDQLEKANDLYVQGKFKDVRGLMMDIMELYCKYLVPPFTDMITLQQRLKNILLHDGNKKFDYEK